MCDENGTLPPNGLPCRIKHADCGRLDNFLLSVFVGVSRSQIANAVRRGDILVNGAAVKAGWILRAGDEITGGIVRDPVTAVPEQMDLDIVFEDAHLMIINKPRGIAVHTGAGLKSGTLLNGLLGRAGAENLERAGIVHRLDKNTAGLLIVAKTAETQKRLGEMFERHDVKRVYLGVVEGIIKNDMTIDKNIIRHPNHRTLFTTTETGGRRAVTHLTVMERFAKYTLCQFELETGRTHQIRVHCKSISHPLVGDAEYNPNGTIKNLTGQMLDAVRLGFVHPMTKKDIIAEIPPSKQLTDTINKCKTIK